MTILGTWLQAPKLTSAALALVFFGTLNAAMAATPPVGAAKGVATPDARAAATEAQLTDAERFQLLHGIMPLPLAIPGLPPLKIPAGVKPTAGYVAGVPRLGIPDLMESDASLGVANPLQMRAGDVSTALPSGLAMAATFNPDTAMKAGALIGNEARAKGFNVQLAGGSNLARDPRNGRNFEYFGEDPLLAGTLAGAAIKGTQSEGVISTLKHYALNDQETLRNSLDAVIDEAGLRESDLLAFEIALERGQPGSVMCSYNKVNGEYGCGNDFLLNKVLKRDWGYKGWVMSDWGAVHDVSYIAKGLDQQSGAQLDQQVWFDEPLQAEVAAGRVPKARISDAVRRILRSLYAIGADRPLSESAIDYAAHAAVVRDAAAQGIVLLKNDNALPLKPGKSSIVVIGGHADLGVLSGAGSSQVTPYGAAPTLIPVGGSGFMGPFLRMLMMPSSPLKALKAALPQAKIDYDSGYFADNAAAMAAHADVAIVFATQWSAEGLDAGSLSLPEGQNELIERVAHANPNTIVVLETGNPVSMPWLHEVKAVVEAWYPGQEGGAAIADVLTGAVNPSGRLPLTFPVDEQQNPRPTIAGLGLPEGSAVTVHYPEGSDVGYRWFASKDLKPLFPFGHGLSYTSFATSGLKVMSAKVGGALAPQASVSVKNTGARSGATVVQVYLVSAAGRAVKRLVGFSKQGLAPGESRIVSLTLDPRLLASWDTGKGRWNIAAGTYRFAIGDSADALSETAELKLAATTLKP
jgi:beta-glucosidase